MKELGWLAFKGMTDELENPSKYEEAGGIEPQLMHENPSQEHDSRKQNGRNAESMTDTIDRVLMACGILRNPLRTTASA